jgi:hypothetical protein
VERIILLVLTPLVAVVLWIVASTSEGARLKLEYVRIATSILQQPIEQPDTRRVMREWAVAILNESSPVRLSPEQSSALIEGRTVLPTYSSGGRADAYYGLSSGGVSSGAGGIASSPVPK